MASLGERHRPDATQTGVDPIQRFIDRVGSMRMDRRTLLRGAAAGGTGLAAAAIVGCGSSSEKTEPSSVQNNNGNQDQIRTEVPLEPGWARWHAPTCTIDYPNNWTYAEDIDGQHAQFHPSDQDYNPYLYFEKGKLGSNDTTIADFQKRTIQNIMEEWRGEIVGGKIEQDKNNSRKIAGYDTVALNYQKQWSDGIHDHVVYIFLAGSDGRTTWDFEFSAAEGKLPQYAEVTDKILNSFRPL